MMRNKTLPTFWRRKIIEPLSGFLTQGLSSQKLALSLAFGITLSTFPVLGVTTILCTLAALTLRLNMPVIQFANYLAYPLQILLLVPYYHIGGLLFNVQRNIDFDTLRHMLPGSTQKEMITMLLESTFYAIGAWLLISPLVLALLYTSLKPVLVRLKFSSSRFKFPRRQT
jgi:uncharacterized protein (DUF2062 family)